MNKFDKVTKSKQGLLLDFGRICILLNFARTLTWAKQTDDDLERVTYWFTIQTKSDYHTGKKRSMHEIIIGPFLLIFAWVPE